MARGGAGSGAGGHHHAVTRPASGAGLGPPGRRLVLALAAGLLLAATAPSYAESRTSVDAAGDPVRTTYDDRAGETTDEPAPRAAAVDLLSTRVDYRRQVLVVRGKAGAARKGVSTTARIRTRGNDYFFTTAGSQIFGFLISDRSGEEVRCPGARAAVDKERATYRLRVPASCFGAPAKVRVGYVLTSYGNDKRRFTETSDDALRTGAAPDSQASPGFGAKLGTALARG